MEEVKIIETTEQEKEKKPRIPKFSYSKLSVYEQCPFKYKLIYNDKNFINQPSIAADFGTLVHFIEETMAKTITSYQPLNYEYLIDLFINAEIVQEEESKNEVDENSNEQVLAKTK